MSGESTLAVTDNINKGIDIGSGFGPIGSIIGGVVGLGKGLYLRNKYKKAAKALKMAEETKRKQQTMRLALQRRQLVQSFRAQRAAAVAAGASDGNVSSSAVAGSTSSVASQGMSSLQYFDSQVGLDNQVQTYLKTAERYNAEIAKHAGTSAGVGAAVQLGQDIYGVYQASQMNNQSQYSTLIKQGDQVAKNYQGPTDAIDSIPAPTLNYG